MGNRLRKRPWFTHRYLGSSQRNSVVNFLKYLESKSISFKVSVVLLLSFSFSGAVVSSFAYQVPTGLRSFLDNYFLMNFFLELSWVIILSAIFTRVLLPIGALAILFIEERTMKHRPIKKFARMLFIFCKVNGLSKYTYVFANIFTFIFILSFMVVGVSGIVYGLLAIVLLALLAFISSSVGVLFSFAATEGLRPLADRINSGATEDISAANSVVFLLSFLSLFGIALGCAISIERKSIEVELSIDARTVYGSVVAVSEKGLIFYESTTEDYSFIALDRVEIFAKR